MKDLIVFGAVDEVDFQIEEIRAFLRSRRFIRTVIWTVKSWGLKVTM